MNRFGVGEAKHRTSISTPMTKKTLRETIAQDTREFLKRGGEIIPYGFLMKENATHHFKIS